MFARMNTVSVVTFAYELYCLLGWNGPEPVDCVAGDVDAVTVNILWFVDLWIKSGDGFCSHDLAWAYKGKHMGDFNFTEQLY